MDTLTNTYTKNNFTLRYKNKNTEQDFLNSIFAFKKMQKLFIMGLTLVIYAMYIYLDLSILPEVEYKAVIPFHFSMIILWVFLIHSIYYNKRTKFANFILHLMPIYAVLGTLVFAYYHNTLYVQEIYVILFWSFVTIGYMFLESLLVSTIMLISSAIILFSFDIITLNAYTQHLFFMGVSWMLGLSASYIIEMYRRINYEKTLEILYMQEQLTTHQENLENRVQEEVDKSRTKDQMIFHQSKPIAMGEMIENIAHQWRQPLSQVNSSVLVIDDELDLHQFKNETIESKLLEIESLTKYMSKTIDDFKNFFDEDKEKETYLLSDTLAKSIKIIKSTLVAYNINIETKFDENITLCGYPNELQHVILVILNNAKDVLITKKIQDPKITITTNRTTEHSVLKISDNAGGITSEIIEKIFEPYYTTKHKSQGAGLGLYISKMIIEDSSDGELYVKNNDNGACFTIKLPHTD